MAYKKNFKARILGINEERLRFRSSYAILFGALLLLLFAQALSGYTVVILIFPLMILLFHKIIVSSASRRLLYIIACLFAMYFCLSFTSEWLYLSQDLVQIASTEFPGSVDYHLFTKFAYLYILPTGLPTAYFASLSLCLMFKKDHLIFHLSIVSIAFSLSQIVIALSSQPTHIQDLSVIILVATVAIAWGSLPFAIYRAKYQNEVNQPSAECHPREPMGVDGLPLEYNAHVMAWTSDVDHSLGRDWKMSHADITLDDIKQKINSLELKITFLFALYFPPALITLAPSSASFVSNIFKGSQVTVLALQLYYIFLTIATTHVAAEYSKSGKREKSIKSYMAALEATVTDEIELENEEIRTLEKEIPSLYDYFYLDYKVLVELCKHEQVKSFFHNKDREISKCYHGYVYAIELAIINLINHLEDLIGCREINELIHWGEISYADKEVKDIIVDNLEVNRIIALFEFRKRLSGIRFSEKYDDVELKTILDKLTVELDGLNKQIVNEYNVKPVYCEKGTEEMFIVNWVLNNYNYIEFDFNFSEELFEQIFEFKEKSYPCWPGTPFSYLAPANLKKNYNLQNEIVKSKNKLYLRGFSATLSYLYDVFIPEKASQFSEKLLCVNTWEELHRVGAKISEQIQANERYFVSLYTMDDTLSRGADSISDGRIESLAGIRTLLSGRDVRVIQSRYTGDYVNVGGILFDVITGAIFGSKIEHREKPRIIEFREVFEDRNRVEYSWAIYIPRSGMFWNSSQWIVFHKVAVESDMEPHSFSKEQIQHYLSMFQENIDLRTVEVKGGVLMKYLEKKDLALRERKEKGERYNSCRGLLAEMLAGYYLLKTEKISDIQSIDVRQEIGITDIDVRVETNDELIIVQAKNTFHFDSKSQSEIVQHFEKIVGLIESKKHIRKMLFVVEDEINENDAIMYLEKEGKVSRNIAVTPQEIGKEREDAIKSLGENNNIEVKFLTELYDVLNKQENKEFICKIRESFRKISERTYEEE